MTTQKTSPEHAALILRVTLGILFLAHASLKIFVFTPAGTVGFFESLGLPGFVAYLTIIAEVIGGSALITGFHARYASLGLLPVVLGAIIFVHGGNGWLFSNSNGGWEFPALWAVALLVQFLMGNGSYAVSYANGSLSVSRPA